MSAYWGESGLSAGMLLGTEKMKESRRGGRVMASSITILSMRCKILTSIFLFSSCLAPAFGQGIEQGPPATGTTAYLSPAEELKLIELQDGYYLELVLSEPQIEEPVDIQFDGNGRMYVLEMRNYMNDADATDQEAGTGVVCRQ
jgi:hypothetical protein